MKANKVQRSNNYMKRRRRKHTMLKIAVSALCIAVAAGVTVLVLSLTANKPQTTSMTPAVNENSATESKKSKVESSEQSPNKSSRDPKLPDYSNSYKYTEKLIESGEFDDEDIDSKYAVLYDASTDTVAYKKSAEEKCFPASTTKLLTAIVASKILKEDNVITVGDEITMIGEESSVAGLEKGQKLTVKQLIYAMILPSGNDAAYTLAVAAGRAYKNDEKLSAEKAIAVFSDLMNDAAKELGAEKSHFVNPDGFHNEDQYSTALDLLKIANYAKDIPLVAEVCGTYQTTQTLKSGETVMWVNSNKLLNGGEYCYSEYADGMKTGFTDEAGSCVIASYTKNKTTQLVVAMNSSGVYGKYYDTLKLAQLGFEQKDIEFTYYELPEGIE